MKRRTSPKIPLPNLAAAFLKMLATTHKPNTCKSYRHRVHRFHQWLSDNQLELSQLHREAMVRWLVDLNNTGEKAMGRNIAVTAVRMYLCWLYEVGAIDIPPDLLLRRTDHPRLPRYLPRPLAPEQDRELQRRLRESSSRYHRGLLLMRKTGVRVGELVDLEYECVRIDFKGRHFLKVPLGKLDNERLVPLDDSAVQLIRNLQEQGRRPRPWLIETVRRKKTQPILFQRAMREIASDLDSLNNVTPHRLRHTYATELINAGMSLWGIMKLLGHRSVTMTLRYADITLETVGQEYSQALTEIERVYKIGKTQPRTLDFDPLRALSDVIRWIEHHADRTRAAQLLVRRLTRSRNDLLALVAKPQDED